MATQSHSLQEDFRNLFFGHNPLSIMGICRNRSNRNLPFRWNFHDWELEELTDLLTRLEGVGLFSNVKDSVTWNKSRIEIFSVKSCYLQEQKTNSIIEEWPWMLTWKNKILTKVAYFS